MEHAADSPDAKPVIYKIIALPAGLIGLALLCSQSVLAVPMRCSGEQNLCIVACQKNPDRSTLSICVTNCGARQSLCKKTGCWDTGAQKYCGLLKQ